MGLESLDRAAGSVLPRTAVSPCYSTYRCQIFADLSALRRYQLVQERIPLITSISHICYVARLLTCDTAATRSTPDAAAWRIFPASITLAVAQTVDCKSEREHSGVALLGFHVRKYANFDIS